MIQSTLISNTYKCADESETVNLAQTLAMVINPGDLITLNGDLGAGKSLFARALIRSYLNQPELEVPSPTYNLSIEHVSPQNKRVTHMDFYRLSNPEEVDELGIEDAIEQGVLLIEWPDQPDSVLPEPYLAIQIEIISNNERNFSFTALPVTLEKISRSVEISKFLKAHWKDETVRTPFPADASSRNYEWVESGHEKRILMDAPKLPDGPVIHNGLPYSQIAHLAEEVRPFVAIANTLREKNFCAPKIFGADFEQGLVLLEFLGADTITNKENQPIQNRYEDAGECLALLHNTKWEKHLPTDDGIGHTLPNYDIGSMMIEAQLLTQWYLKDEQFSGIQDKDLEEYNTFWSQYSKRAQSFRQSIVLRDYHSPNIIWKNSEKIQDRIGMIDFQDAVIGPAAYDVVSLAQDARICVSSELESGILHRYLTKMRAINPDHNDEEFAFEYALMGALRASKVLGFCVRVDLRDGKPQYRALIPQIRKYLKRNLQHPGLRQYRDWCKRVINL